MENEELSAIPALGYYPKSRISMGTTLIAIQYADGVVVGTDSRTSRGSFIASRATDKITPVTKSIVVCRSGSAADTQAIADIVKFYVELYGLAENRKIGVHRVSEMFRNFLYDYRDNLNASVIIAGYDEYESGQIYVIPLGGYVTRQQFAASGSGSTFVMGYLDKLWRPNLSLEETKNMVRDAVHLATYRDGSSGGVIRLAVCNNTGTHRELVKPPEFPELFSPPSFSMFPKHCEISIASMLKDIKLQQRAQSPPIFTPLEDLKSCASFSCEEEEQKSDIAVTQ